MALTAFLGLFWKAFWSSVALYWIHTKNGIHVFSYQIVQTQVVFLYVGHSDNWLQSQKWRCTLAGWLKINRIAAALMIGCCESGNDGSSRFQMPAMVSIWSSVLSPPASEGKLSLEPTPCLHFRRVIWTWAGWRFSFPFIVTDFQMEAVIQNKNSYPLENYTRFLLCISFLLWSVICQQK